MYRLIKINIYAKKHISIALGSVAIDSHLKIISRPAHRKLLESVQEIIKTTIFLNWSHFYINNIFYLIYCIPFNIICRIQLFWHVLQCVELIWVVYISFKINRFLQVVLKSFFQSLQFFNTQNICRMCWGWS